MSMGEVPPRAATRRNVSMSRDAVCMIAGPIQVMVPSLNADSSRARRPIFRYCEPVRNLDARVGATA